MRYRNQDANGDYLVGRGTVEILHNVPAAVALAVKTRLLLEQGEWFLDVTEGTPYRSKILSDLNYNTKPTYDAAIRERILDTRGVTELVAYHSSVNPDRRTLTVTATVNTLYGQATINQVL